MTFSLYSTCKGLRREARRQHTAQVQPKKTSGAIQNSVCHALNLLGMGVEGVSCGGDAAYSGRRL